MFSSSLFDMKTEQATHQVR